MSDWSPPQRPGYTKTGQSLKAVRRYYALKDQANRRKRSPDREDRDEDRIVREEKASASAKRKRSPDDDKLSKRIAAELKVQAEANEKRSQRQSGAVLSPTERSDLPLIVQPREAGPTFITATNDANDVAPIKSVVLPAKSAKSNRSAGIQLATTPAELPEINISNFGSTSKGCLITCIVLAFSYIATWLLMIIVDKNLKSSETDERDPSFQLIAWLAMGSVLPLIAIPYWFLLRNHLMHAIGCLFLMIMSTVNVIIYIIYTIIIHSPPTPNTKVTSHYINEDNPLNFWLSITYMVLHLVSTSFMIKQLMNIVKGQIKERSNGKPAEDQPMSLYLSPG